ncbi:MAG: hypothetical protein ABSE89_06660 [Sedimentisphaerales bacterium]
MQKLEDIFRLLLFMVSSAIGICAVSLAVLAPEWENLYQLNAAVRQTERNNQKIESIIKDHQILTSRINADPNILRRIAPVTLGVDPCEPNQPSVKITADTLASAKAVLEQQDQQNSDNSEIPIWLARCTADDNRIVLFSAGAGLIVVSFACFGRRKEVK